MSDGMRSYWASSRWYSTITFWPSTYPVFVEALLGTQRRCPQKPLRERPTDERDDRHLLGVCARVATGHAAVAPPSSVMNSRRRIFGSPKLRKPALYPLKRATLTGLKPGSQTIAAVHIQCLLWVKTPK